MHTAALIVGLAVVWFAIMQSMRAIARAEIRKRETEVQVLTPKPMSAEDVRRFEAAFMRNVARKAGEARSF